MRAHCIAVTSSNFPDQSKIKRSGSVSRFKALGRRTSLATTRNGALRIPVYDHHGNVVAVVDDGGATVAAYEYAPFGALGAQSDSETGLSASASNTIAPFGPRAAFGLSSLWPPECPVK